VAAAPAVVVAATAAVAAVVAAAVVAMAVSAAPTALVPVAAAVAARAVAAVVTAAATAATDPCDTPKHTQTDKRLPREPFSLGDRLGGRADQASPLRFFRSRPCTARSSMAFGSMRMILATTPICQGITR